MSTKPILFNTDMTRATLEDRKTATRRPMKGYALEHLELDTDGSIIGVYDQFEGRVCHVMCYAPHQRGDTLYVRETFQIDYLSNIPGTGRAHYKADDTYADFSFAPSRYEMMRRLQMKPGWRPSENMPREAARIFLRVTDVRVEKIQDITITGLQDEGVFSSGYISQFSACTTDFFEVFREIWNSCYAKPRPVKDKNGFIDHYESYPWEDIQETRTYKGKPWYVIGNPWIWVIEFERMKGDQL